MATDVPRDLSHDDHTGRNPGVPADGDDDDLPGTSLGPRPRLGDFGASEAEQRSALGLRDEDDPPGA
jgi:hypothetical protein